MIQLILIIAGIYFGIPLVLALLDVKFNFLDIPGKPWRDWEDPINF